MTSLVFPDAQIEADFLGRRCNASADLSSLTHAIYGVGWALAGLRLCTSLARSGLSTCAMTTLSSLAWPLGLLRARVHELSCAWCSTVLWCGRATVVEPTRLVFVAVFYTAGALVHASLAAYLRNGAPPCASCTVSARPVRTARRTPCAASMHSCGLKHPPSP